MFFDELRGVLIYQASPNSGDFHMKVYKHMSEQSIKLSGLWGKHPKSFQFSEFFGQQIWGKVAGVAWEIVVAIVEVKEERSLSCI